MILSEKIRRYSLYVNKHVVFQRLKCLGFSEDFRMLQHSPIKNSTTELICVHAYLLTSKHFMCYLQTSKIAISSTRILCWLMRTRTGKKVNQLNNKIHLSIDKKNLSPFWKKELRKSMCSNVGHHIF